MGQHAGGADDMDRRAQRVGLALPGEDPVARREGELHRVGEADHHDERRHHVEEHVEPEIEPAEHAERQQNGEQRRRRGDDHEGDAAEEQDGDEAAAKKAERVVDDAVALDRVADFELHHRHAGQLGREAGAGEILVHRLADFADDIAQLVALDDGGVERQHDQGQLAVEREQLAAQDFVAHHLLDERIVGRALRQRVGEERRRQVIAFRRLARRKQRDDAARAVDQLQVGDEVAKLAEIVPRRAACRLR